jgi:Transposase DDE domain group 1
LPAASPIHRAADLVVHEVQSLVGQRVFGIALGYEDLIDHDQLRHDPVMAVLGGKLEARRADCAPLAGKSTLNRLELSRPEPTRYHKISYDAAAKLRRAMVKHRGRERSETRTERGRRHNRVAQRWIRRTSVIRRGPGQPPAANPTYAGAKFAQES